MFKDMEANKQKNYFEVRKNEDAGLALIEIAIAPFFLSIFLAGIIFLFNLFFPIVPHWLLTVSVNLLKVSLIFPVLYFLIIVFAFLGERRIPRKVIKNKQINSNKVVSDKFKESDSDSVIEENKVNGFKKREIKRDTNFYKSHFFKSFKKKLPHFPLFVSLARHLINMFISFYSFLILWFLSFWIMLLIFYVLGLINIIFNLNIILPISHYLEFIAIISVGTFILTIIFFYQLLTPLLKRISSYKGSLIRFKLIYGTLYLLSVPINTIVFYRLITDSSS